MLDLHETHLTFLHYTLVLNHMKTLCPDEQASAGLNCVHVIS